MTTGRNDPCPCGSGKKYKKCCGAKVLRTSDFGYDRIRRLDAESGNLLMRFAKQHYGDDALENAWEEFRFSDGTPFDMSSPEADFFLRWFTFNWRPREAKTLAELFLSEKGSKLDSNLRRFIEATLHAPYSFFQTLEVDPGAGLTLRDVLRKCKVQVKERSASTILQRGQIVFARVVEMDDIYFMMGNGSHVIPPTFLDRLLDLRTRLEREGPLIDGSVSTETLLDLEDELRDAYFEIEDNLKNQRIEVRNTDGDPLALYTLTYAIPSLDEAFHALKDLEQEATGCTDEELLAEAERNEAGQPTRVHIHWLRTPKKRGEEGITSLATLTISASTLVAEVNSEKRSSRIQKEIKKRLGMDAVLLRTEITSHEGVMKEAAETEKDAQSHKENEHDRLMRDSPEARALVKRMMESHWATWPDTPLPALRGMTPRRAAKDPQGRELLESLLMDFELRNRSQEDEFLRVDTAKLRRDLGLEAG
ncbi:MAG: YecA family protein [Bacteroidota bacterium]